MKGHLVYIIYSLIDIVVFQDGSIRVGQSAAEAPLRLVSRLSPSMAGLREPVSSGWGLQYLNEQLESNGIEGCQLLLATDQDLRNSLNITSCINRKKILNCTMQITKG